MHNFRANYDKILEVFTVLEVQDSFLTQIRKPQLSDKEIVAISLVSEYMAIDSECQLFRILPKCLSNKIERSVYNRRRRNLFEFQELIRQKLANHFLEFEDYFIIDSMPLEVCKYARASRSKVCRDDFFTAPDRGYCASQRMKYYGYKLHMTCSVNGIISSFDISKASLHDINYLHDVKLQLSDCVLLGDRGYLSSEFQLDLFETVNIKLETPMRKNQHNYREQPYLFKKSRKRIETLFSQLCDQFMIRRNYAKSFKGFKTRILAKITALTNIQYINKFIENRKINNLKVNIA